MAFESHRIRFSNKASKTGPDGKNPANLAALAGFFVFAIVFLLPLFPPFGFVIGFVTGKALVKELQIQGILKKNVEGKYTFDKDKAKTVGQRDFAKAREQYKTRLSESDRMEERLPREHGHTPDGYSYDICATERRLEQIKALKEAGILDEKEYQQRKARILAGK